MSREPKINMTEADKQQIKNEFILSEYNVTANEYIFALQGAQTVIVINLAISIGIIAAMITLLATGNIKTTINLITFIVLACVGLLGAICCICTLYVSRKQLIILQGRLLELEKEYGTKKYHSRYYYKPLHYTLLGFWVFAITFMIIMSICLVKLIVPKIFNFCSVTIVFFVIVLCLFGIAKISDHIFTRIEKNLLRSVENEK